MNIIKNEIVNVPSQIIIFEDSDGIAENFIQLQNYMDGVSVKSVRSSDGSATLTINNWRQLLEIMMEFSKNAEKYMGKFK